MKKKISLFDHDVMAALAEDVAFNSSKNFIIVASVFAAGSILTPVVGIGLAVLAGVCLSGISYYRAYNQVAKQRYDQELSHLIADQPSEAATSKPNYFKRFIRSLHTSLKQAKTLLLRTTPISLAYKDSGKVESRWAGVTKQFFRQDGIANSGMIVGAISVGFLFGGPIGSGIAGMLALGMCLAKSKYKYEVHLDEMKALDDAMSALPSTSSTDRTAEHEKTVHRKLFAQASLTSRSSQQARSPQILTTPTLPEQKTYSLFLYTAHSKRHHHDSATHSYINTCAKQIRKTRRNSLLK